MAKKILSVVLCLLLFASITVPVYAESNTTSTTSTNPYTVASQEIDTLYGYDGDDLGANYTPEKTTFKVWSPTATEVNLNLFATGTDAEEGAADLGNYSLEKVYDNDNFTGVWSVTVIGDLKNIYYTYTITAENVTGETVTTKETQDVYSVATGANSQRSMVCDLDSTDPEGWENDNHVLLDSNTESVVWEIHVKDFTYSVTSGVSEENRGKYIGFTERGTTLNAEGNLSTCIDYLKELGVTTVQILPFYDYGSVDETGSNTQFNWGYDPMNYNVPEGSYSSNPYDGNVRIKECKQMIQALHNAGISVVMDVVYNHTYSYNSCFNYTVPNYYYRMKKDGSYSDGSGCGNEMASERLMYRNYIIQSCLYWVNEYHVDGFRFDLMGVMDVETMNLIREELDKVDERITMWGEGWTGGTCTYPATTCSGETLKPATLANAKYLDSNIALFNDSMRDNLKGGSLNATEKGWVQGSTSGYKKVYNGIFANTRYLTGWSSPSPSQCVTYASCHDNMTLWDKLCVSNDMTDYYDKRSELILAQNKLAAGVLGVSQGILFLNAGEEMGRTKLGDHNSYSSPAEINMIDWSLISSNADLVSYYRGLLQIRDNFAPITDSTTDSIDNYISYISGSYSSKIAFTVTNDTEGQWDKLAFLANNTSSPTEIDINNAFNTIKEWVIIANDECAGVSSLGTVTDGIFTVPARSIIIAVDKASYEEVGLTTNTGKVTVNYIDKHSGKVMDKAVITGSVGSTYQTSESTAIDISYVLSNVDGDTIGTFAEEDQVVNYYYEYYVPDSMSNDVTGDGKTNIRDATIIQEYLAEMKTLDDFQIQSADYNMDGKVDINDVTTLQMHLAKYSVGTGTVTVNYYKTGTQQSITNSVTYVGRVGEIYDLPVGSSLGYVLNTDNLPENDSVVVAYGANQVINYYYDYVGSNVTIHIKHNGDLTWAPTIWIWGQSKGEDSGSNYCKNKSWPGDTLEMGEDGWYTTSFEALSTDDAYNIIISNNGGQQSVDAKGFTQLELWIVIDDANSSGKASLLFFDSNPEI